MNLNCPCLRTVKTVAREGAWGQSVGYAFNYTSAAGQKLKTS